MMTHDLLAVFNLVIYGPRCLKLNFCGLCVTLSFLRTLPAGAQVDDVELLITYLPTLAVWHVFDQFSLVLNRLSGGQSL